MTWTDWIQFGGVILAAVIAALTSKWVADRAGKTQDKAVLVDEQLVGVRQHNAQIDQLQEDVSGLRSELSRTQGRVSVLEERERAKDDYIAVLRDHIDQRKPPPPPPWPLSLLPRYHHRREGDD